MARRPKIHPYFLENAPSHWDITAFLEQQLKEQGKSFDQNKAIGSWTASLKHLSQDEDPGRSSVAKDKTERYYLNSRRGQPSDRILAQNWLDRTNKGRRRKEQRRLAQTPPAPVMPKIRNTFNLSGATNNVVGAGVMNNRSEGSIPPPRECTSENLSAASPSSTPGDPPEEDHESTHLRETRLSCGHLYRNMVDKFTLSDGRLLEDILYNHAVTLDKLSPAHFFIVDDKLLKNVLKKPEEKEVPRRVLREVRSRVLRIPPFPKNLHASMMRYQDSKTTAQCRAIARDSPDDEDVHWIDDVFRHIVELITNSGNILSYDFLNEGVWDSLVYPPLWDKYLASIPTIVLQRYLPTPCPLFSTNLRPPRSKEIQLVSLAPYSYLPGRPPHYDGVVQSRSLSKSRSDRRSDRYEFAIFEVSRSSDPKKLSADREKLVAGCRAMLSSLMEVVEYDTEAIARLVVVGVLQGGRGTRLLTMSCIGRNVFYLVEGSCWKLPVEVKKLTAVNDVLRDVWKAKWAIMNTAATIDEFFAKKDMMEEEERRRRWEREEEEEEEEGEGEGEEEGEEEEEEEEKGDGEGEDED